jgi:hypothetical protein
MNKITRENIGDHLIEFQLKMVGKTVEEAMEDKWWFSNITMTKEQHTEFMVYALPLVKKVLRCNKEKAWRTLDWFNLQYGLRIHPTYYEYQEIRKKVEEELKNNKNDTKSVDGEVSTDIPTI